MPVFFNSVSDSFPFLYSFFPETVEEPKNFPERAAGGCLRPDPASGRWRGWIAGKRPKNKNLPLRLEGNLQARHPERQIYFILHSFVFFYLTLTILHPYHAFILCGLDKR